MAPKKLLARKIIFSADGNAFAYSRHSSTEQGRWETVIEFINKKKNPITIKEDEFSNADMYFSSHAKYLVYMQFLQGLQVWDLSSSTPKLYKQEFSGYTRYSCISSVMDNGYVIANDARIPRLGIYKITSDVPRVSTLAIDAGGYSGQQFCAPFNPTDINSKLIFSDAHGTLHRIDFHDPLAPKIDHSWSLPVETYPLAATQDFLFATTAGSEPELRIYRLDLDKSAKMDWVMLNRNYESIMKGYRAEVESGKPVPYVFAVSRFENVGISSALNAPVEDITPQKASEILNDYGFLEAKFRGPTTLIEHALKRSIELDPNRALAHLNLADFLRNQLSIYGATGRDVDSLRKDIELHYRTYLALGGKLTHDIDIFLKDDKESHGNICHAIADYANAGRLGEFVSGVGTNVLMAMGEDKRVDLIFTTEGTAHVPSVYAYDSTTDIPIKADDMPEMPPGTENAWGGDNLGLFTLHNKNYFLFYKDLRHPVSATSLENWDTCEFSSVTKEIIGPKATEAPLCAMLQRNKGPKPYTFDKHSPMDREKVSEKWGESEIRGTHILDVANDGKPVNVAELQMTSSAGAGCDETFYETVNTEASRFLSGQKRDLLMQLQAAMPTNRYPIGPCGNKPSFFSYKNRIYFETKSYNWPPVDTWNQYHRVTTIIDGQVREVCNFQFETKVMVKTESETPSPK